MDIVIARRMPLISDLDALNVRIKRVENIVNNVNLAIMEIQETVVVAKNVSVMVKLHFVIHSMVTAIVQQRALLDQNVINASQSTLAIQRAGGLAHVCKKRRNLKKLRGIQMN